MLYYYTIPICPSFSHFLTLLLTNIKSRNREMCHFMSTGQLHNKPHQEGFSSSFNSRSFCRTKQLQFYYSFAGWNHRRVQNVSHSCLVVLWSSLLSISSLSSVRIPQSTSEHLPQILFGISSIQLIRYLQSRTSAPIFSDHHPTLID